MTNPIEPAVPVDPTTLASGQYTSAIILNRIFNLLLNMIGSLQNATAAQASRLDLMASWQKSYTDAMAQMKTFSLNDGIKFLSGKDSGSTESRGTVNQADSALIQSMQNRQSLVADSAKALQSNVNQSNDAANQQSSIATAILQELSTLLGTIFR